MLYIMPCQNDYWNKTDGFSVLSMQVKGTVLGLDILPGDRQKPHYAAVVIDNQGKKLFQGDVNRYEIYDLIKRFNVNIIAIDNVFELFPSSDSLSEFLRSTKVKLLQVTGPPGKEVKLSYLASLYGLTKGGKLSPQAAAEISARLALMGVGSEAKIFEDITEISITRTRSLGEGGQHQAKYARVIASVIQHATREIEDILRKNKINYDTLAREGDFGIKSAKIIVYAPYKKIKRLVGKYQGDLFKIDIRPIEREKLTFIDHEKIYRSKKLLICGIDPGETTGLAILDLSGNILYVGSKKSFGLTSILETIYEYGKPILIASDVPKMPQFLEKICRKVGAVCIGPSHVYSVSEKNEIVRQLPVRVSNAHERDALIAALLAFRRYKQLFQKVDNILSYFPMKIDKDLVKKEIIFGCNIKDAISRTFESALRELLSQEKNERNVDLVEKRIPNQMLIEEKEKLNKKLSEALERIARLEDKISSLESALREKDKEIEHLHDTLLRERRLCRKKLRQEIEKLKDSYIRDLETKLAEYRRVIQRQKAYIRTLTTRQKNLLTILQKDEKTYVVKRLAKLTLSKIESLEKTYGILKGDILYIEDCSGIGKNAIMRIIEKGVHAVIIKNNKMPLDAETLLREYNVPILKYDDFDPPFLLNEDIALLSEETFKRALRNMKLRTLPEEEAFEMEIEEILNEWREQRLKEIEEIQ